MIAREWKCRCPEATTEGFLEYMYQTGVAESSALPGFMGAQAMLRQVEGGNEITLFTYWESLDAIKAFAGQDMERAKLYPGDATYGIEPDLEGAALPDAGHEKGGLRLGPRIDDKVPLANRRPDGGQGAFRAFWAVRHQMVLCT